MTALECVEQSKVFSESVINGLTDMKQTSAARQVFFMDNYPKITATMEALKKIVNSVKNEGDVATEEQIEIMNNAKAIMDSLQRAITMFQQELMINQDVQEDELEKTPGLTAESIQEASANNATTQNIIKEMNDIAQAQSGPSFTHCLVCDGTINMFTANTKDEVVQTINKIAESGNYKQIELYKMAFTPISMKKKTVLTI